MGPVIENLRVLVVWAVGKNHSIVWGYSSAVGMSGWAGAKIANKDWEIISLVYTETWIHKLAIF